MSSIPGTATLSRLWLSILRKIITLWARPRILPEDIKRALKRKSRAFHLSLPVALPTPA